jgi:hypothetical protein
MEHQNRLVRFLENHDEPRAAATFPPEIHAAAAVITFFSPGLRFFQQGQFEGRMKRISPHLGRGPDEPVDARLQKFYGRLLAELRQPALRDGQWRLLQCTAAWDGNWTWDSFIAFAWQYGAAERLIVAVNYAAHQSQCYVRMPFTDLENSSWRFEDRLNCDVYDRDGNDLQSRGLYLDLHPWQACIYYLVRKQELIQSKQRSPDLRPTLKP